MTVSVPNITATNNADSLEYRVNCLLSSIEYKPNYRLILAKDKTDSGGRFYLQVEATRPDVYTRELGVGRGGKAYLSPHMTDGELLRIMFGLFLAYEEHECREFFKWRNRAIFGPHVDPKALWSVAETLEFRE